MVSEIGTNSNISVSSLQAFRAVNAFKAANTKATQQEEENNIQEEPSLKSDFVTEGKLANLNEKAMGEIKNMAQKIGEELGEDEIKYGMMYGRSVLIDYSA